MYANRDAAVPVSPQRGLAALPILALCCLLFILLMIASVIVLALIPIYLSSKQATSGVSSTRSGSGLFSLGVSVPAGSLDAASLASLARAIEKAQGLPTGSVVVTDGTATPASSRRKRRGLLARSERANYFYTLIFKFYYKRGICGRYCTSSILSYFGNLVLTSISLTFGGNGPYSIDSIIVTITSSTPTATTLTSTASSVTASGMMG